MPGRAEAEPGERQEPGSTSGSSAWFAGTQALLARCLLGCATAQKLVRNCVSHQSQIPNTTLIHWTATHAFITFYMNSSIHT